MIAGLRPYIACKDPGASCPAGAQAHWAVRRLNALAPMSRSVGPVHPPRN